MTLTSAEEMMKHLQESVKIASPMIQRIEKLFELSAGSEDFKTALTSLLREAPPLVPMMAATLEYRKQQMPLPEVGIDNFLLISNTSRFDMLAEIPRQVVSMLMELSRMEVFQYFADKEGEVDENAEDLPEVLKASRDLTALLREHKPKCNVCGEDHDEDQDDEDEEDDDHSQIAMRN